MSAVTAGWDGVGVLPKDGAEQGWAARNAACRCDGFALTAAEKEALLLLRQPSQPGAPSVETAARVARLSPSLRAVLTCVCRAMSNKEIARELRLSPYTVKNHLSKIMLTLRVTRRDSLVVLLNGGVPHEHRHGTWDEGA